MGGALPKYREPAKCQRVWARRLAFLMCVCTCGWVFACIMRISRMCVKQYILYACSCVCADELVCTLYAGKENTGAEDYAANILTLTIECRKPA